MNSLLISKLWSRSSQAVSEDEEADWVRACARNARVALVSSPFGFREKRRRQTRSIRLDSSGHSLARRAAKNFICSWTNPSLSQKRAWLALVDTVRASTICSGLAASKREEKLRRSLRTVLT